MQEQCRQQDQHKARLLPCGVPSCSATTGKATHICGSTCQVLSTKVGMQPSIVGWVGVLNAPSIPTWIQHTQNMPLEKQLTGMR